MARTRIDKNDQHPVDIHVGTRVKARRLMLGLSQDDLAKAIGLTFQQIQKYEKGTNRISVSRLSDISKALKVPTVYFMEGLSSSAHRNQNGVSDTRQEAFEPDPMMQKDVLELVRAYSSIDTPQLKKQLLSMAKALADQDKKD